MKKNLLLLCALLGCTHLWAQAAMVEIHHIGAGDGDGTMIVVVDTTNAVDLLGAPVIDTAVILIDGQRSSGGKEVWRYMRDTLTARFPTVDSIDAIVVSHLHIDHYGGIPRILDSIHTHGWGVRSVFDRQNVSYDQFLQGFAIVDTCYDSLKVGNPNAASFNTYNNKLQQYGLSPTRTIQIGDDLFTLLGYDFKTISMTCEVAYGATTAVSYQGDTSFLPVQQAMGQNYYTPKSENDLSIGFLLQFEGYNYLTTGDLGGIGGGNYVDGETPMTKGIQHIMGNPGDYHICSNKVSHHGSRESSSQWFATTNDFTVSVIPASLRSYGSSAHALPTQTAIQNLQSTGRDSLFYTFVPNSPQIAASYWTKNNLDLYNDVIIKVVGPPGYGQTISMTVIQRSKTKQYVYQGAATVRTINCNKGHAATY